MKNKSVFVTMFFLFSTLTMAGERDFKNGHSYQTSDYFKEFDKDLTAFPQSIQPEITIPYEYCTIRHSLEKTEYTPAISSEAYIRYSRPSIGFFFPWREPMPKLASYFLVCWVGENDYAVGIPIHVGKLKIKGFSLELMFDSLKFEFENLDGSSLASVRGKYKGSISGVGFGPVGKKKLSIVNKNKIQLKVNRSTYAGLFGIVVGKAFMEIGFGDDLALIDLTKDGRWKEAPIPMKGKKLENFIFKKIESEDKKIVSK